MGLEKIISGGQTGVDQGVLQAAIDRNIDHGGWCPPGRTCETGIIPSQFKLFNTTRDRYSRNSPPRSMRTFLNVRDSDGTLVLFDSNKSKGTKFAKAQAIRLKRPLFVSAGEDVDEVMYWLRKHDIKVLNIAGPSEKEKPGANDRAFLFIIKLLELCSF